MPEADGWQVEKDFVAGIYEDLYDRYLARAEQYKNTERDVYRNALRIFRREKRKFRKMWRKQSEEERTIMARGAAHWNANEEARDYGILYKRIRPFVFK